MRSRIDERSSGDEFRRSVEVKLVAVNHAIAAHAPDPDTCPDDQFVRKSAVDLLDGAPSLGKLRGKWRGVMTMLGEGRYESFDSVVIMFGILPTLVEALSRVLDDPEAYSLLFQRIGNNIRAYSVAYAGAGQDIGANIFEFSKRIDCFCRVLRHYGWAADASRELGHGKGRAPRSGPVFIVVSSFKNIFEAYYLKRKYPTFYLMAISGDERREDGGGFLRERDRSRVDLGEDLSTSKNLFKRYHRAARRAGIASAEPGGVSPNRAVETPPGMSASQLTFCENVAKYDELRMRCYLGGFAPFILQDVMTCIENADVFATRDLSASKVCYDTPLVRSFARFITLALHPGLLKPTKVERCMQIAMTAKLSSGCLSRQVGAVVADADYQILSLGWNDVPCGSESCARRSLYDVAARKDWEAYSTYELGDPEYRDLVQGVYRAMQRGNADEVLGGLPAAYCFKDAYQHIIGVRDQIHTRSLHAEERALAACGNERARGACLFTTSSPCELCAKKAREAQVAKIYYIEQYPGISHDHVIGDGADGMRPSYEFFTGVVGAAYAKLYTPLIPYKDELEALGIMA